MKNSISMTQFAASVAACIGTHGSDLEEDLNVLHFFGAKKKEQ